MYSLSPYSIEERITRDFVDGGAADVVLDIADATNLERNLYLTLQLLERGKKVVVALNMMDELEKRGIEPDAQALSAALGAPVVPISARKEGPGRADGRGRAGRAAGVSPRCGKRAWRADGRGRPLPGRARPPRPGEERGRHALRRRRALRSRRQARDFPRVGGVSWRCGARGHGDRGDIEVSGRPASSSTSPK